MQTKGLTSVLGEIQVIYKHFCPCSAATSQSVGLLWTRDQLVVETSTSLTDNIKHSQQTDRHPCPLWDWNPQSQQARDRRPTP